MNRTIITDWYRAQCREPYASYFLYFKPSAGKVPGEVCLATAPPDGFQLADPRRISPAWTMEQAQRFITEVSQRLPILATE